MNYILFACTGGGLINVDIGHILSSCNLISTCNVISTLCSKTDIDIIHNQLQLRAMGYFGGWSIKPEMGYGNAPGPQSNSHM